MYLNLATFWLPADARTPPLTPEGPSPPRELHVYWQIISSIVFYLYICWNSVYDCNGATRHAVHPHEARQTNAIESGDMRCEPMHVNDANAYQCRKKQHTEVLPYALRCTRCIRSIVCTGLRSNISSGLVVVCSAPHPQLLHWLAVGAGVASTS